MRLWVAVLAIALALLVGRYTVPEPPARVRIVKDPIIVYQPQPGPVVPIQKPVLRRRATLEDIRRDWGIEGRLSCSVVQR